MPRKSQHAVAAGPSYKPGNVVYLRSGGPEMTIESIEPTGELNCVWFTIIEEGGEWQAPLRHKFLPVTVQFAINGDREPPATGDYGHPPAEPPKPGA